MADQKITELDADATPTTDDLIVTVDSPGGSPASKKATLGNALKLAPHLVDRAGNLGAYDYTQAGLTTDGNFYDLDLSAIVPAGATWVYLRVSISDDAAGSSIQFRKNGSSGGYDNPIVGTQVAAVSNHASFFVPCDSGRVIEYKGSNLAFTSIGIAVLGWIIDTVN